MSLWALGAQGTMILKAQPDLIMKNSQFRKLAGWLALDIHQRQQ